jgi:protein involved in polysaccharide export with SLBB domain
MLSMLPFQRREALPKGCAMAVHETNSFLRRRSFFVALLALAACDGDTTPIVQNTATDTGESLNLAPTKGMSGSSTVPGRDPAYKLGPNDRIRIIVFGQPTLTGEFTIDGNGTMSYPLIGNIPAGGMTVAELQRTITLKLEPDYLVNPSVSAEVVTRRPFYVIGEVQKPGNYPYVTDMTVLNAVAMAGGFTYRARKNDFYIKRSDKNGRMVRVLADSGTVLRPGDTLEVRERYF